MDSLLLRFNLYTVGFFMVFWEFDSQTFEGPYLEKTMFFSILKYPYQPQSETWKVVSRWRWPSIGFGNCNINCFSGVCVSFFGMWKPTKCKVIRLSWKPGINRNPGFFRIQVFVPKFGISKPQRSNQGWPGNWLTWIFWTWTQNLHQVHSLDLEYQVTKAFEVPIGIIRDWRFFFRCPKCHETFLGKWEAISR